MHRRWLAGVRGGVRRACAAGPHTGALQAAAPKKQTFVEKMAPLAAKIAEYILDHEDDVAQEERWRTMMKRDTAKSFREQRAQVERVEAQIRAQVQKVESQVETNQRDVQRRFDSQQHMIEAVNSKLDTLLARLPPPRD